MSLRCCLNILIILLHESVNLFYWKSNFFLLPLDGVILVDPEALQGRKGLYKTPELILLDSFFCIYVHGHSHTGLKELHLDSLF